MITGALIMWCVRWHTFMSDNCLFLENIYIFFCLFSSVSFINMCCNIFVHLLNILGPCCPFIKIFFFGHTYSLTDTHTRNELIIWKAEFSAPRLRQIVNYGLKYFWFNKFSLSMNETFFPSSLDNSLSSTIINAQFNR